MPTTATMSDEAREFFARNPDPALRALVDQGVEEYGRFMGGSVWIDALENPETGREEVIAMVEADASAGSMMARHHEFMNGWRARHPREEWNMVHFSVDYV